MIFSKFDDFLNVMKKNNVVSGLVIFDVLTVLLLFILPIALLFYGDIGVIIAAVVGMYFTFHNRKETQRILKISLIFIIFGTFLISLTLSIMEWILTIPYYGLNSIVFLSFFITNLIMVFIYTIIIGLFMGYFYSREQTKDFWKFRESVSEGDEDEFF